MTPFLLRPSDQALLIVDMQNDFLRPAAPQEVPAGRRIVPAIAALATAFRKRGQPVIYTRFLAGPLSTLLVGWSPECGPEQRSCWPGELRQYPDREGLRAGVAVVDELEPQPGELVVDKFGYGAFHNTLLGDALRARHLDQVVVTGVVTQICVEDTVRQGMQSGFEMVLVSDGVASFDDELHHATLRNVAMKFGVVVDTERVLQDPGAANTAVA